MTSNFTAQQILSLPLDVNDAYADTIGQFLATLTEKAWVEEEDFSGKRPWGNSAWQGVVARALISANVISGAVDEDGYITSLEEEEIETVMDSVFAFLKNADWSSLKEITPPKEYVIADMYAFDKGLRDFPDVQTIPLTKAAAEAELAQNYVNSPQATWDYRILHFKPV
jgi:hypothetical protein